MQVLRDEAGMGPDELQQLTYFLCHNYARCTRSVSMVPAVYYSHLAAKRAQIFSTCFLLRFRSFACVCGGRLSVWVSGCLCELGRVIDLVCVCMCVHGYTPTPPPPPPPSSRALTPFPLTHSPHRAVSDSETSTEVSGDSDEVYDLTDAQWSAKMTPMKGGIEARTAVLCLALLLFWGGCF